MISASIVTLSFSSLWLPLSWWVQIILVVHTASVQWNHHCVSPGKSVSLLGVRTYNPAEPQAVGQEAQTSQVSDRVWWWEETLLFLPLCSWTLVFIQVIGDVITCVKYSYSTICCILEVNLKSSVCCSSSGTLAETLTDHSTVLVGWLLLSDELIC